jgi:hypothetical protein
MTVRVCELRHNIEARIAVGLSGVLRRASLTLSPRRKSRASFDRCCSRRCTPVLTGGISAFLLTRISFPCSALWALIAVSDHLIIFREEPGRRDCRVFRSYLTDGWWSAERPGMKNDPSSGPGPPTLEVFLRPWAGGDLAGSQESTITDRFRSCLTGRCDPDSAYELFFGVESRSPEGGICSRRVSVGWSGVGSSWSTFFDLTSKPIEPATTSKPPATINQCGNSKEATLISAVV